MQVVAEKENDEEPKEFRYGVPAEMYAEWRAAQKRIGLPQTQIIHRLVRFLLDLDEVTQAMVLGTIEARKDLIEFALQQRQAHGHRVAAKKRRPQPPPE